MSRMSRLQTKDNFRLLFRQGRRYDSPFFRIVTRGAYNNPTSRFAFIISRGVEKRAVLRNRLRRRTREWVRRNLTRFPSSVHIAFLFKKAAFQVSRATLYEELDRTIRKI